MADEWSGGGTPEHGAAKPDTVHIPVAQVPTGARPFGPGSFPAPPPGAYAAAGISQGMLTPKQKSRTWLVWVLSGVAVLVVLAVVGGVKAWHLFQGAGKEEIVPLHEAMRRGDFAGILASSDPSYKEEVGEEKNSKLFTLIHDKMGDPLRYTLTNVSSNTTTEDGQRMTLILDTTFTKGVGEERLLYHKDAGVWRLVGYHCRSTLLNGYKDTSK